MLTGVDLDTVVVVDGVVVGVDGRLVIGRLLVGGGGVGSGSRGVGGGGRGVAVAGCVVSGGHSGDGGENYEGLNTNFKTFIRP